MSQSKTRTWAKWIAGLSALWLIAGVAGCGKAITTESGETHFVTCKSQQDCSTTSGASECDGGYCVDQNGDKIAVTHGAPELGPSEGGAPDTRGAGGAGATGVPAEGGAGAASADCSSPVLEPLADWQERTAHQTGPQQLAATKQVLVGSWHGSVTTPWVPAYAVSATFGAAGDYSAHCDQNSDYAADSGCCRAFYYGSDLDSPLKRWDLTDIHTDGKASGTIDIAFCDSGKCWLPGWQGELSNLDYDQTGNRLRFDFDKGNGRVTFDLERDK